MKNYFRDFIVSPINTGLQNIQNFFKTMNGSDTSAHSRQNHQDSSKRNKVIRLIISIGLMLMLAIAVLWRPIKALFNMFFNNTNVQPVKPEESNTVNTPATETHAANINLAVYDTTKAALPATATSTVAAPLVLPMMKTRRCGAAAAAAATRDAEGRPSSKLEPQ